MKGYVKIMQWYIDATHVDQLIKPEGEEPQIRTFGGERPEIVQESPKPKLGEIVFSVADDGSLTLVDSNFDSSG